MDSIFGFFQLLGVLGLVFVMGAVVSAPYWLAGFASSKRDEWERQLLQQAELDRKIAIAEAGMAARARGEAFVPPPDYGR
jgi:hypothetical protein